MKKVVKGARDFLPIQMCIRRQVFNTITSVFEQHGAVEIDTPIFELKDTLLGKYGEEGGKLIYDLQDQGGEILSLRYDLTVPFARFLGSHGIKKIKRFHIGKVYRRDNPSVQQGRYREFFQCDFDIAGDNEKMMPDAELIKMIDQIFTKLDIGKFVIKVSNRKILDAMIQIAGIDVSQFKTVCSTIDKLDKMSWAEVKKELIEKKGVSEEQANKLGEMVCLKGDPFKLIEELENKKIFEEKGKEAVEEMKLFFKYLKQMNGMKHVIFDLSLARGLDYYTGLIQETVLEGTQVGSVSGGGRYDQLVGVFSQNSIPCVGASIGIERVFALIEKKLLKSPNIKENPSDFIVAVIPSKNVDMNDHRFQIYDLLWEHGYKCDIIYKNNWNLRKQLDYANDQKIPYAIVFGEDEIKQGIVKLKNLNERTETSIQLDNLAEEIQKFVKINKSEKEQIKQEFNDNKKQEQLEQQEHQPKQKKQKGKFSIENLSEMDKFLGKNLFLGGEVLSEEDIQILSQLSSVDKNQYPNLERWYSYLHNFEGPVKSFCGHYKQK